MFRAVAGVAASVNDSGAGEVHARQAVLAMSQPMPCPRMSRANY
jgi:hypothetical protein